MNNTVPKEILLWGDIAVLKTKTDQEEVDRFIKEVYNGIFQEVIIDEELRSSIESIMGVGKPLKNTIFDQVQSQIEKDLLQEPKFPRILWNFAQGIIYCNRYHKENVTFPDSLYRFAVDFIRGENWKSITSSDRESYRSKNHKKLHKFVVNNIRASPKKIYDYLVVPENRPLWDNFAGSCETLESHGNFGGIDHIKANSIFLPGMDVVFLRHRTLLPTGEYVFLACSVEHNDVPIVHKAKRMHLGLSYWMIEKVDDQHTSLTMVYETNALITEFNAIANHYRRSFGCIQAAVEKL
eukprot:TRINITY_DN5858_c0_g1_i2.p1 TRINITY_DN5858_c0_g1~~TRINITY_DN5858_c0_g1_i2.p1  ORF type:complete len:295 (+),score=65.27 TRINITY_DN5858_c0_g1_i2:502-1386(+)